MDGSGRPARTSLIYHFGMEGLGELELEDEPDQTVSYLTESKLRADRDRAWKGASHYEEHHLN